MYSRLINLWSGWSSTSSLKDASVVEVITALIVLLIVIYTFLNNRHPKGEPPLPPGPRGLPVVGYLPFLGPDLRYSFRDLANVYGPIFKLRLGFGHCIVVTSPSLVREVLKDQGILFANRSPSITTTLATFGASDIVFSDSGPEWRKIKRIFVSDLLGNANLKATNDVRKKQVQKMINRIYNMTGESVDIGEVIFSTMLSSIMTMVWGESLTGNDADGADGSEFRSVVTEFMVMLGAPNVSD